MDDDTTSTLFDQFILMLSSSHQSVQLEGLIGIRNLITNEPSGILFSSASSLNNEIS